MIKRFALLLSALLSLGLHAQAQTYPSPTVQNFTVLGTMTASGLPTSGTIANSLCQTSAGTVLSVAGVNCFGGGGGSLTLTDGTHTVTPTTQITVTGGTVGGSTPNATLTITGASGVTSVATIAPISGGTITGTGTISLTGPSSLTTFTANAFPVGAGASPFAVLGPPSSGLGVLSGWNTSNVASQIILGTNLSMTGSTLNATGGGSSAFSALTSGTNTTMAGVIGSGASITLSGSGVNVANQVPAALGTGIVCSTAGPLSVSAGCPIIPTVQAGASFALVAGNAGQLVLATNASPTTISLAQSTGSLGTGWGTDLFTEGNTSTLTPTTSKINNLTAIKLGAYQDIALAADSAGNYVGALSVPQPPTQTHTTCLFDDMIWSACSGSGTLTASGSITNGSLGIWASGTSLSGTVVPGTGVLTFLATPSSANLAATVTGETGTGALVFGTSPTIASPAFSGTSTGTYTLGGTLTLGNGAVATTQTTGDNTTKVATDAFVIANAGGGGTVTNLTLAPGFTTTIGTQNTAGQNITTTGTINGQLWPEPKTVNYTVLTSDTGALPLANGSGSITFTLPNPATGTKGATYQFNDESGHGYTMATVGATADFLGCSGGGSTTLAVPASTGVSVVDNGTSYSCLLYGGGGGGLPTIANGHIIANATGGSAAAQDTSLAAGTGISLAASGGTITITNTSGGGGATITPPQGRLTLTSHTPILAADVTGATTLYYDSWAGGTYPNFDGTVDQTITIAANEVSDVLGTTAPAGVLINQVVDEWGLASGVICHATDGSGHGWSSDTGGSNVARGTGYSQLDNTTRYYVTNKNALANCYNGATNEGSIAANKATYLGTFWTLEAAGAINMQFHVAFAAGGTAPCLCLFNGSNRVVAHSIVGDTNSWNGNNAGSWGPADVGGAGSGLRNRVSWVDGKGVTQVSALANMTITSLSTNGGEVGVDYDSASATPRTISYVGAASNLVTSARDNNAGLLGGHFAQLMEWTNQTGLINQFPNSSYLEFDGEM